MLPSLFLPRSSLLFACLLVFAALLGGVLGACDGGSASPAPPPTDTVAAAEPNPATHTAELMVQGVSCASCSVAIRQRLNKVDGIVAIREGNDKKHLLVDFIAQLVSTEQILQSVSDAGYEAELLVREFGDCQGRAGC